MKNKVIGLILALVVILSSVGGFALADVEKGTLQVSFMTGNIRIAVNILAQQLGYFAEEGVTVQEVSPGSSPPHQELRLGQDRPWGSGAACKGGRAECWATGQC